MFNLTFDLPPRDRPGVQSEDVEILVGGKSILRDTIRWEVHAAVVAAPSSLMSSSETSRDPTLLVRAMDDRPFRILGIDAIPKGVTSRGLDDATRPRHSIRFLFQPSEFRQTFDEIRIRTDHPRQPILTVPTYTVAGDSRPMVDTPPK
jgi:hypothetical protein